MRVFDQSQTQAVHSNPGGISIIDTGCRTKRSSGTAHQKSMTLEQHHVRWLYKETVNFLDRLAGEVREGKNVMVASVVARFLQFSGLHKVFEAYPSSQAHLEVNAAIVTKKVNDLLYDCGEQFRGGKFDPKYNASDVAEINRKLDLLISAANAEPSVTVIVSRPVGKPVGTMRAYPASDDRIASTPDTGGSVHQVESSDRRG